MEDGATGKNSKLMAQIFFAHKPNHSFHFYFIFLLLLDYRIFFSITPSYPFSSALAVFSWLAASFTPLVRERHGET